MTPSYDESKYFSWTDRHVGNLSIFFEDDYNLINNKDSKLFLGWTLDMRKMMGDKKQVYSINETSACLLYTSPSPRDLSTSRMPSSA